jgi:hypothetical protein
MQMRLTARVDQRQKLHLPCLALLPGDFSSRAKEGPYLRGLIDREGLLRLISRGMGQRTFRGSVARTCSKPNPWGDLQSRLFGRRDNGLVHHHADIV